MASGESEAARDIRIPLLCFGGSGVEADYLRQIHRVRASVDDVSAGEGGSGLVRHGMSYSEQRV